MQFLGVNQRRPLVTRPVQRMGQQQQGPMTSTLPQQYGQQQSGPYATNVGQRPFMPYGGGAGYQAPSSPYGGIQGPLSRNQMPVPLTPQQQRQQQIAMRPRDAESLIDSDYLTDQVPSNANPFSVRTPGQIRSDPAWQQQQQWEGVGRSKQYGDFTGGGTPVYGGGRVIGPPGGMTLSDQDQQAINRERMYAQADPAGPYSGTAGMRHFGPLQGQQPQAGPLMVSDPNASAFTGDAARVQAHNAAGGNMAYRDTQGTPNAANLAYAARADQKQQMLQAGRNVRANRQHGTPLRPDLFPQAQAAYAQQQGGGSPGALPAIVDRYTTHNEDGSTSKDYPGLAGGLAGQFRDNPTQAWKAFQDEGGSPADLQDAIDATAPGAFSRGDPETHALLIAMQQQAIGGNAPGAPGPLPGKYTPGGVLGSPKVMGPSGESSPPRQPGETVVRPTPRSYPPSFAGAGPIGTYTPPADDWNVPTLPPPNPPRRRPGPAYRPNF